MANKLRVFDSEEERLREVFRYGIRVGLIAANYQDCVDISDERIDREYEKWAAVNNLD